MNHTPNSLKQLIAIQSTADRPAELKRAVDVVVDTYKNPLLKVSRWNIQGKPSALIAPKQHPAPKILLYAHLDVVPAAPESFRLRKNGGRMMGRGVGDMKTFAVLFGELLLGWANANTLPSVGLLLTSDEEVGGMHGTQALLDKKLIQKPTIVIMPDGGDHWQLVTQEKALMQLELTAGGRAAHGSRPWLGKNALLKLMHLYARIDHKLNTARHEGDGKPSVNLAKIETSNTASNIVPSDGVMTLDLRIPTDQESKAALIWIKQEAKKVGISVTVAGAGNSSAMNYAAFPLKEFRTFAQKFLGRTLPFQRCSGASDARFFSAHGIPTVITKPLGGGHHTPDEWIDWNNALEYQRLVKEYTERFGAR